MHADQLAHTFIARGDFEQLREHHGLLRRVTPYLEGDGEVFRWFMEYAIHFKRYPSFDELAEWVSHSPSFKPKDPAMDRIAMSVRVKDVAAQTVLPVHQGSWPQIIEATIHEAREGYWGHHFRVAMTISTTGTVIDGKNVKGVEAALAYIDQARRSEFAIQKKVVVEAKPVPTVDELYAQVLARRTPAAEPEAPVDYAALSALIGAEQ